MFYLENIAQAPVSPSNVAILAARSTIRVNRTNEGLCFFGRFLYGGNQGPRE
jgi:hypothetical protein